MLFQIQTDLVHETIFYNQYNVLYFNLNIVLSNINNIIVNIF